MIAAVLSTLGVAVVSAFLPVIPIEPYLLGAVAATGHGAVVLGLAAGVGQTAGKVAMFAGARGTLRSAWLRRWLTRRGLAPAGPTADRPGTSPATTTADHLETSPATTAAGRPGTSPAVATADQSAASPAVAAADRTRTSAVAALGSGPSGAADPASSERSPAEPLPPGRWRRWRDALARAMTRPALTGPVLLLSALIGLPPLLVLVVYVATATRMRLALFTVLCLVGRSARFVLLAVGLHALLPN